MCLCGFRRISFFASGESASAMNDKKGKLTHGKDLTEVSGNI